MPVVPDRLSRSLQENIVTLICFDDSAGKIIRNSVGIECFDSLYKILVERVFVYIDEYGETPKEHTPDLFDDILNGKDKQKSKSYKKILLDIDDLKDTVNSRYVLQKLNDFVRKQQITIGIMKAIDVLQTKGEEGMDEIETVLLDAIRKKQSLFDPGVFLSDTQRGLEFLKDKEEIFTTGIHELDYRRLGPMRGGLHLFIALPKRGKTWWLISLGKRALLNRLKVCHITLEISEELTAQRYYQSLFSVAKRGGKYDQIVFGTNKRGYIRELLSEKVKARLAFDDPSVGRELIYRTDKWGHQFDRILIKQFPTGDLTIRELEAYLDLLEDVHNFIPDLLIVDYADLMQVGSIKYYREALGTLYKELRGIAVKRNIAIATASQSNREGSKSDVITDANVAEDFSKIATADTVITYNQTIEERQHGLARLFVANSRTDEDRITILISQNYSLGQFVRSSAKMTSSYWTKLKKMDVDE